MRTFLSLSLFICLSTLLHAQWFDPPNASNYLEKRWKTVATRMPDEWYSSDDAKRVADNVLLAQKDIGGWAKNKPYHHILTEEEKQAYKKSKPETGATFDNGATITELDFLAKMYAHTGEQRYKDAFLKGVHYIFKAQYKNGGWPQFYPVRTTEDEYKTDHTAPYSAHITYNDNAMYNIMVFLKQIYTSDKALTSLQISDKIKNQAQKAFNDGIECILNTQIVVNGKPTVWCAQHNEITLAPANARAYELASFSGAESVGIVHLLMDIDHPSPRIIAAVEGAVDWFEKHKIEGIKISWERTEDGKRNRIVVEDSSARPIWGRFYDLETEKIYFCDRDGIKRNALADIGYERRNGYSWYTYAPQSILDSYPEWKQKIAGK